MNVRLTTLAIVTMQLGELVGEQDKLKNSD